METKFQTRNEQANLLLQTLLKAKDDSKILKMMTDSEWQRCFLMLRGMTPTTDEKRLKRKLGRVVIGRNWTLSGGESESMDGHYVNFINSVLKVIRGGEADYCYHTYQIAELLRFESRLQTELIHDGDCSYFEVWLD